MEPGIFYPKAVGMTIELNDTLLFLSAGVLFQQPGIQSRSMFHTLLSLGDI